MKTKSRKPFPYTLVAVVIVLIVVIGYVAVTRPGLILPSPNGAIVALPPVIPSHAGIESAINLATSTLSVKEIGGAASTVTVDKATLSLVSGSSYPTYYLVDAQNVYVFDAMLDANQPVHATKKNPNPVQGPYVLYHLPLSPTSFHRISYLYVGDDSKVLYYDEGTGSPDTFTLVDGIDAKTAYSPNDTTNLEYINPADARGDVIADTENVYVGATKLVANQNFHFINWNSGQKTYQGIYGVSGSQVVCVDTKESGGNEQYWSTSGHLLTGDASTFAIKLINGENYYAQDNAGHTFINCAPFANGVAVAGFTPEPAPTSSAGQTPQLLILTTNALYGGMGTMLVERTGTLTGFKYLDTKGDYFALDGKTYWYESFQLGNPHDGNAYLVNGGNVDLNSFSVVDEWTSVSNTISSFGLAKDAQQAYVDYYDTSHHEVVFTPKDIASFTDIKCPSRAIYFKDSQAVYAKDGSVVTDASPATFATSDPRCSTPVDRGI